VNAIACMVSSPRRGLTIALDLGGTLSSCPAVHLNCIRDRLYQDACISISDRVLIQVCRWVVFGESPLDAGSLLAHSSQLTSSIVYFHCSYKVKISLLYFVRLYSYCTSSGTYVCMYV